MKKMKKLLNIRKFAAQLLLIILVVTLSVACVKDIADTKVTLGSDQALVRLLINTPKHNTPSVVTRGVVEPENAISEVKILVFSYDGSEYRYLYTADGEGVNSSGGSTTFTAVIRSCPTAIKLMLLANANSAFLSYTPQIGDSEATVKERVSVDFNKKISGDIPMWGEIIMPSGILANVTNNLATTMLRSVARVDVVKSLLPDSYSFDIRSVSIFRTNDIIQVVPNEVVAGELRVDRPSVPASSQLNSLSTVIVSDEVQSETVEGSQIEAIRKVYTPCALSNEVDSLEGVTSVVVGGYFNHEPGLSYYRMDFDSKVKGHPFGQILRNHKYIFNVKRVWGRGWPSAEEAATNLSSNISVKIEKWNDFVIDMAFDGEHHLGFSERKVVLLADVNSEKKVLVDTDLNYYTVQWADEDGNGLGVEVSGGEVLDNGIFRVQVSSDLKYINVTSLLSNQGSGLGSRLQNLLVKANRFEIVINIEQLSRDNSARSIRVLSVRSYMGYLGSTEPGTNFYPAHSRALGLRALITNSDNFGPQGTVQTAGFYLSDVAEANSNSYLTDLYLSLFDVVYLPNIAVQSIINPETAQKVVSWLQASEHRVLLVSMDQINRNKNTFDALGAWGITWLNAKEPYPLAPKTEANSYFTHDGPFCASTGIRLDQSFSFRNYDRIHGEISQLYNPGITPILMGPSGDITLGVDYRSRVVYIGDVDIFNTATSAAATTDNRLTSTTGEVNNSASVLIANLWAWVAATVMENQ